MKRNYSAATLAYGELDEIAEIIDGTELTADDIRSVCLNLIREIQHLRQEIDRINLRLTALDGN